MRAFLSSAFERFFSLFVYAHELLTYDPTLYPHTRTASTREVTADLTYAWRGVPPENRRSGHGHHCCRDRAPTRVIAMRARRLLPIVHAVLTTSSPIGACPFERLTGESRQR
jgi:truncated hemoglobin YjbI